MRVSCAFLLTLAIAVTQLGCGGRPATSPVATVTTRACDVWAREASFARSVAAHDAAAFAEHVSPNAVFVEGDGSVLRGRAAIVDGWKPIVTGDKLEFVWTPTSVYLAGDGRVAVSRGPYYFHAKGSEEQVQFGTYQSTWTLESDGVWRVAIDGGTPPTTPVVGVDAASEVARIRGLIGAPCKEP